MLAPVGADKDAEEEVHVAKGSESFTMLYASAAVFGVMIGLIVLIVPGAARRFSSSREQS